MAKQKTADQIAFLAKKWNKGTISEKEKQEFDRWYESFDDSEPTHLSNAVQKELKERIYNNIFQDSKDTSPARTLSFLKPSLIAASILLFVFLFTWGMQNSFKAVPFVSIVSVSATSHIQKVILPDGTIIWLKPGSTLEYPGSFASIRKVAMTGEALFEVAKDREHPFMVTAGDFTATVLGTSFNLQVPENNKKCIELSVLTGKVRVAAKNTGFKPIDVLPNKKLKVRDKTVKLEVSRDVKVYTAGTEYNMDFTDTPFNEVVSRIEKKFNVRLSGDLNSYASCRLTANLTDQSLQQTLKLITASLDIKYKISADKILINGGGCL